MDIARRSFSVSSLSFVAGAIINVPLFINEGDKIKIDTEKGSYIERVK